MADGLNSCLKEGEVRETGWELISQNAETAGQKAVTGGGLDHRNVYSPFHHQRMHTDKLSVMFDICNPRTQEAKAGGSGVQGQPGLHSETLSQKKPKKPKKNAYRKRLARSSRSAWRKTLRNSVLCCPQRV
jgi:hypothetical protein